MSQKTSFLSVKYRMFSYLPCGLSAERSCIQRKAQIIRFFLSSLCSGRHTFFFIKLMKHTVLQNILITNILLKIFFWSGIKLSTFQNREEFYRKNGVKYTLSSCVIWCAVLILVLSHYLIEKREVCFSKYYVILSIFNEYFVN